jgi:hypothetical protein
MSDAEPRHLPAPVIALAGWIVPGLGYFLIGQRARAYIAGTTILLTFLAGIFIGGIRVIDVPTYDIDGSKRLDARGNWRSGGIAGEVMYKPWYIAQSLTGPVNIVATWVSLDQAHKGVAMSSARIFDIGTLYTAVAGMLNLLVIIDAAYRSTHPPKPETTPESTPQTPIGPNSTPAGTEGGA